MQGDIVFESRHETKLQKCFKMYLLIIFYNFKWHSSIKFTIKNITSIFSVYVFMFVIWIYDLFKKDCF